MLEGEHKMCRKIGLLFLSLLFVNEALAENAYFAPANLAADWLQTQQNSDGSWGNDDSLKVYYTSRAVIAMQTLNRRNAVYFKGLTWLENHQAENADSRSRRIRSLVTHGDDVNTQVAALQYSQHSDIFGWGLDSSYKSAALDTALVLKAYASTNESTNLAETIGFLKNQQLNNADDKGWTVALGATSDPYTTAQVSLALLPYIVLTVVWQQ
jgi:hypothetical protein